MRGVTSAVMHKQERALIARLIDGLTAEQLCEVPDGYGNNILWNLGHLVVAQQLLVYGLSDLDMYVDDALVDAFRGGTSPADWESKPDIDLIKRLLTELPERFEEDLRAGRFGSYRGYTTSTGLVLQTFEEGVAFNDFHEGVHTGVIMALKKRVT